MWEVAWRAICIWPYSHLARVDPAHHSLDHLSGGLSKQTLPSVDIDSFVTPERRLPLKSSGQICGIHVRPDLAPPPRLLDDRRRHGPLLLVALHLQSAHVVFVQAIEGVGELRILRPGIVSVNMVILLP